MEDLRPSVRIMVVKHVRNAPRVSSEKGNTPMANMSTSLILKIRMDIYIPTIREDIWTTTMICMMGLNVN